jgi:hypothetical protein
LLLRVEELLPNKNNIHSANTQAKGDQSYHTWGLAIDIIPKNGMYDRLDAMNSSERLFFGTIGESHDLVWGGRWVRNSKKSYLIKTFGKVKGQQKIQEIQNTGMGYDPAHFDFSEGLSIQYLRTLKKDEKGYVLFN